MTEDATKNRTDSLRKRFFQTKPFCYPCYLYRFRAQRPEPGWCPQVTLAEGRGLTSYPDFSLGMCGPATPGLHRVLRTNAQRADQRGQTHSTRRTQP